MFSSSKVAEGVTPSRNRPANLRSTSSSTGSPPGSPQAPHAPGSVSSRVQRLSVTRSSGSIFSPVRSGDRQAGGALARPTHLSATGSSGSISSAVLSGDRQAGGALARPTYLSATRSSGSISSAVLSGDRQAASASPRLQSETKDLAANVEQMKRTLSIERAARLALEREVRSSAGRSQLRPHAWPSLGQLSTAQDPADLPLRPDVADFRRTIQAQQQQIDTLSSIVATQHASPAQTQSSGSTPWLRHLDEGRLLERWTTEYEALMKANLDRHVLDLKAVLQEEAQQAADRLELLVLGIRDDVASDHISIFKDVNEILGEREEKLEKRLVQPAQEQAVLIQGLQTHVDELQKTAVVKVEMATIAAAQMQMEEAMAAERAASREIASLLRKEINSVRDDAMSAVAAMETAMQTVAHGLAQSRTAAAPAVAAAPGVANVGVPAETSTAIAAAVGVSRSARHSQDEDENDDSDDSDDDAEDLTVVRQEAKMQDGNGAKSGHNTSRTKVRGRWKAAGWIAAMGAVSPTVQPDRRSCEYRSSVPFLNAHLPLMA
jgi:hypothetical protein